MGRSDEHQPLYVDSVVANELKVRAFEQGFAQGANPLGSTKRHSVEPNTHEFWRRGFEAGRRSRESGVAELRKELAR